VLPAHCISVRQHVDQGISLSIGCREVLNETIAEMVFGDKDSSSGVPPNMILMLTGEYLIRAGARVRTFGPFGRARCPHRAGVRVAGVRRAEDSAPHL
jgi:hypothetical protein